MALDFRRIARSQRALAWLMLCVEAAALGLLSQTLIFPLAIVAAGLVGLSYSLRLEVSRRVAFYLLAAMAVVFVVKAMAFPHEFPPSATFYGTPVTHAMAQFFLVWQTAWFFVARRRDRLPLIFPMLGAFALLCMANVIVFPGRRDALQALIVAYVLLTGAYFAAGRRTVPAGERRSAARIIATGTVALLVGAASWGGARALDRFERDIEVIINKMLVMVSPRSSIGYSGTAELGSIARQKASGNERVVLRIVADDPPGYLRGRAFDVFLSSGWRVATPSRRVEGASVAPREFPALPSLPPGLRLFVRRQSAAADWRVVEVWPDDIEVDAVFAPLGTTHLQAPAAHLNVNEHGIFERFEAARLSSYVALAPRDAPEDPPDGPASPESLAVPDRFHDPEHPVAQLAAELFAGAEEPAEKARRVVAHFHRNHQYRLGIDIPFGRNALEWFLLERPPAHCEFFAAGAAILLRLGGVPSRYVTGFVAHERQPGGGYWIARDRDAHAWVEAWIPERGWVTVEATPGEGVPCVPPDSGWLAQVWEAVRGRTRILWTRLARGGMQAALERAWKDFVGMPGVLSSAALVGACWLAYRIRRRQPPLPTDKDLRALHQLRRRVDARLRRAGLVRRPEETPHCFAERIVAAAAHDDPLRAAAEWYRRYAVVLYRGETNPATLAGLRQALPA